jgi:outer membrane protein assembly factor BamB
LSHEIEKYVSGTGELVAWVKVPFVSDTVDTDIFMYYDSDTLDNQQNVADVWSNGYVGVWHLKETSGGSSAVTRNNSTSGNNALTDVVSAASGDGQMGDGADFEKNDSDNFRLTDGAQVGLDPASTSTHWTYSAWFKPESTGVIHYIMSKYLNPNGYYMSVQANNTLGCRIQDQAGTNLPNSTSTIAAGTWYYFTCAWDGSNIRLYWNASNEGTLPYTGGIGDSTNEFYLGGTPNYSDGVIDEVRVSNVLRTAAWITTEYNNQFSPATFFKSVGAESSGDLVIGGDQGGKIYALNGGTGLPMWTEYSTDSGNPRPIQAAVAVQLALWGDLDPNFRAQYGGNTDVIFAASMNGLATTDNKLFAIKATNGALAWSFNGTVEPGTTVYEATGMPAVSYELNRVYLATKAASGRSLWVINSLTGSSVACPACNLGVLDSSPSLNLPETRLYVGSGGVGLATAGNLYALDTGDLTLKWTFDLTPGSSDCFTDNGCLKGFVSEDWTVIPSRLYFTTTTGKVMCVETNGETVDVCQGWPAMATPYPVSVVGAGTPLVAGMKKLFVGSSDGRVHQIDPATGTDERQVDIDLTPKIVGDVSTTWLGTEIFVGTEDGKIYQIDLVDHVSCGSKCALP